MILRCDGMIIQVILSEFSVRGTFNELALEHVCGVSGMVRMSLRNSTLGCGALMRRDSDVACINGFAKCFDEIICDEVGGSEDRCEGPLIDEGQKPSSQVRIPFDKLFIKDVTKDIIDRQREEYVGERNTLGRKERVISQIVVDEVELFERRDSSDFLFLFRGFEKTHDWIDPSGNGKINFV